MEVKYLVTVFTAHGYALTKSATETENQLGPADGQGCSTQTGKYQAMVS